MLYSLKPQDSIERLKSLVLGKLRRLRIKFDFYSRNSCLYIITKSFNPYFHQMITNTFVNTKRECTNRSWLNIPESMNDLFLGFDFPAVISFTRG